MGRGSQNGRSNNPVGAPPPWMPTGKGSGCLAENPDDIMRRRAYYHPDSGLFDADVKKLMEYDTMFQTFSANQNFKSETDTRILEAFQTTRERLCSQSLQKLQSYKNYTALQAERNAITQRSHDPVRPDIQSLLEIGTLSLNSAIGSSFLLE